MAEGIAQRYQTSPVMFMDFALLPRTGGERPSQRCVQIRDEQIQMQRRPVTAVVALHTGLRAGTSGSGLVQQVERYGCAEHLDDRTVEQHAPDAEAERLLIEGHRGRQIGNIEVEQQLHDQSGLSSSSRETG